MTVREFIEELEKIEDKDTIIVLERKTIFKILDITPKKKTLFLNVSNSNTFKKIKGYVLQYK